MCVCLRGGPFVGNRWKQGPEERGSPRYDSLRRPSDGRLRFPGDPGSDRGVSWGVPVRPEVSERTLGFSVKERFGGQRADVSPLLVRTTGRTDSTDSWVPRSPSRGSYSKTKENFGYARILDKTQSNILRDRSGPTPSYLYFQQDRCVF